MSYPRVRPYVPVGPLSRLSVDRRILRDASGKAVRMRGLSQFSMVDVFASPGGRERLEREAMPLFRELQFNFFRTFPLGVDPKDWGTAAWGPCALGALKDFHEWAASFGFYVQNCLVTSSFLPPVDLQAYVNELRLCPNALVEKRNEPQFDKAELPPLDYGPIMLVTDGEYGQGRKETGAFGTAHTPRDEDHDRKCHDLEEYFRGGGPWDESDPAFRIPWTAGEPKRPDQFGCDPLQSKGYFAGVSRFGAGGIFHYEGGKTCTAPNAGETTCMRAASEALLYYDAELPNTAPYSHYNAVPGVLREYQFTNGDLVRIRPSDGVVFSHI